MNKMSSKQGYLLYPLEESINNNGAHVSKNEKLNYIKYINKKLKLIVKFIESCYAQSLEKEINSKERYDNFINLLKQSKDMKILESNESKYTSIRISIDQLFYHFSYSNKQKSFFSHNIIIQSKASFNKVIRFQTMIEKNIKQPEGEYVNFHLIKFDLEQKEHTQELIKNYNLNLKYLALKDDFKEFSDLLLKLESLLIFSKKLLLLEEEFNLSNIVLEKIKSVKENFDSTILFKDKDYLLTFEKKYIIDIYENLKKYANEINNIDYSDVIEKEKISYFLNNEINTTISLLELLTHSADRIKLGKKETDYTRCLTISFPFDFSTSVLNIKERSDIMNVFLENQTLSEAIKKIARVNKEFIQYKQNKSFSIFDEI